MAINLSHITNEAGQVCEPVSFEDFVATQDLTPEERAAWTEDKRRVAYSGYVEIFYRHGLKAVSGLGKPKQVA